MDTFLDLPGQHEATDCRGDSRSGEHRPLGLNVPQPPAEYRGGELKTSRTAGSARPSRELLGICDRAPSHLFPFEDVQHVVEREATRLEDKIPAVLLELTRQNQQLVSGRTGDQLLDLGPGITTVRRRQKWRQSG